MDWLAELGHGALWLYVYAYTRSLLGDTPGVCHLDQGLSSVATLCQSGRTSVRRWLDHDFPPGSPPRTGDALLDGADSPPGDGPDRHSPGAGTRGRAACSRVRARVAPARVHPGHKTSCRAQARPNPITGSIHLGHRCPKRTQAQSIRDTR